ncbi:hypothetical protein B0J17DRAFT_771701 [Rhizoctonia solani]|nr:hypothetical protein B0J17DRAFT_771701 [Rhizoctonia solani]
MTEQPKSTKIAISHTRNLSTGILPINALPVEVLAHIFHLVLQEPCRFHQSSEDGDNSIIFPRFPDYLAQVCSLWRQVAFDCPQLWRHIDLTRNDRWYEGLFARARKHEYLVDQPWIELHIAEEDGRPFGFKDCDDEPHDYQELQGFASSISSRMETLEMVVLEGFGPFHRCLLSGLLRDAQRPALKKLVLWSGGEHRNTFIIPFDIERHEMADEFSDFAVNMTEDELARGYSTIDVLHGRGIFPSWSSTAYHGLVDLRLLSTYCWSNIEEREIVSILKSSPGLRILHFGLEIRDLTLDTEHVTPVDLQGLQVVKLFSYNGDDMYPSGILRLLAPGTKPLRLSLEGEFKPNDTWITELDGFFLRSRVAKFYANTSIPPLSLLLCYAANLDLRQVNTRGWTSFPGTSPVFTSSKLGLVCGQPPDLAHVLPFGDWLTGEELSEAFPAVKTLRGSARDPTADWDILD